MEMSKHKKGSDDYLVEYCDSIIGELVHEKEHLVKAYNYFNGIRDHFQYEHLEQNDGVGNPTSIGFTPLTRKHIEAIVGEYLSTDPKPRISCKDPETLTNIFRQKQLEVSSQTIKWIQQFLKNSLYEAMFTEGQQNQQQSQQVVDQEIQREIEAIKDSVNRNFISNYEIAAQNICNYVLQDRRIDFKNKLEQGLLNLLITGEVYYKIVKTHDGTNFRLQLLDPLNVWVDKDPKSRYMKNGYKSVVRHWMSPEEVIIKYGDSLTQEDIDSLPSQKGRLQNSKHYLMISGQESRCGTLRHSGIIGYSGVHPYDDEFDTFDRKWDLIPVYEVEWIDWVKDKNNKLKGNRYTVTRIGQDIFVLDGEDKDMQRDADAKNEPRLSINGMWYTNGHGAPYSLILATAALQDNYDLLLYKKDNLIALSGTTGAIVDVAQLPEMLGNTMSERLQKYQALRKVGLAVIDTSQEGSMQQNTFYGGFDDTKGMTAVQYIQMAIQMTEEIVSSITGVFRERLGGIEARDAVHNVEVGMQQSYIITKRYYQAMDTLVSEMLMDCMDMAKVVYKKGLTGEIILGQQKSIFEIAPEYYTTTSFDIHLADSAEIIKEQDMIKQLAMQLAGSNQVDPEILFIVTSCKSLTEMRELTIKSIREKKLENNQLQQLQQQLEEAQKNMQQMQQQLEQSTKQIAKLNEKKLNIEQQNNQMDQELGFYKVEKDYELKTRELDLIEQRNKLEAAQLLDDSPENDEIVNRRI